MRNNLHRLRHLTGHTQLLALFAALFALLEEVDHLGRALYHLQNIQSASDVFQISQLPVPAAISACCYASVT